jgi:hypothetical protein
MQALCHVQRDGKVTKLTAEVEQLRILVDDLLPTFQWQGPDVISIVYCGRTVSVITTVPNWLFDNYGVKNYAFLHLTNINEWREGPQFWYNDHALRFEFTSAAKYVCRGQLARLLLDRLKALDIPALPDANRAQLRQFLDAAAQLLD